MTDLIILATLLPGPKHGYQLKHEAGIILGQEALHNNLVYPLLRRFMNNKWVVRKAVPGERGQTRQQYALTALGRQELVSRLSSFTEQDARSSEAFRFRVTTFQLLAQDTRERILSAREAHLQALIEKLKAMQKTFSLDPYSEAVIAFSRAEAKSELNWIARVRKLELPTKE